MINLITLNGLFFWITEESFNLIHKCKHRAFVLIKPKPDTRSFFGSQFDVFGGMFDLPVHPRRTTHYMDELLPFIIWKNRMPTAWYHLVIICQKVAISF